MTTLASHWWADGKYLGMRMRGVVQVHGKFQWPEGLLFYCPTCGEAWGRMQVETRATMAFARQCARCPQVGFDIPGSMWIWWDFEHNNAMPEGVLAREFRLHIEAFDRGDLNVQAGG